MKIAAIIRDRATEERTGSGANMAELHTSVLEQAPAGYELTRVRYDGRVDGKATGVGMFQSTQTSEVEAEGRDYPSAKAALDALVPASHAVMHYRVVS